MNNPAFKWKHFAPEIILWCLRWYGSTPMSYANLSDMLAERGVSVNRSALLQKIQPGLRIASFLILSSDSMTYPEFKWKHFAPEIIIWSLRWYGSPPMSYANLSDMLAERGVSVNRSTIYRWFIEYAPTLRKKLRRHQFIRTDSSWQLDETYMALPLPCHQ